MDAEALPVDIVALQLLEQRVTSFPYDGDTSFLFISTSGLQHEEDTVLTRAVSGYPSSRFPMRSSVEWTTLTC